LSIVGIYGKVGVINDKGKNKNGNGSFSVWRDSKVLVCFLEFAFKVLELSPCE
jgi:hypothetical protein